MLKSCLKVVLAKSAPHNSSTLLKFWLGSFALDKGRQHMIYHWETFLLSALDPRPPRKGLQDIFHVCWNCRATRGAS